MGPPTSPVGRRNGGEEGGHDGVLRNGCFTFILRGTLGRLYSPVGGHNGGEEGGHGGDEGEPVVLAHGQQQVLGEGVQLHLVRYPSNAV